MRGGASTFEGSGAPIWRLLRRPAARKTSKRSFSSTSNALGSHWEAFGALLENSKLFEIFAKKVLPASVEPARGTPNPVTPPYKTPKNIKESPRMGVHDVFSRSLAREYHFFACSFNLSHSQNPSGRLWCRSALICTTFCYFLMVFGLFWQFSRCDDIGILVALSLPSFFFHECKISFPT